MQLPSKRILPMNELCLTSSTLYPATIKFNDNKYKQKRYKGICEKTSKIRYANHKKSQNLTKFKNDTTLSIEYWSLKKTTASKSKVIPQCHHQKKFKLVKLTSRETLNDVI